MNEYLQKYGQKAIQAYKKSLRMSQSLQKDNPSPLKQQPHILLPKKCLSKRSLKSSKRTESQVRLAHSKSIRNVSRVEDQQGRKKGASFIDGSKKLLLVGGQQQASGGNTNGFSHTFSKAPVGSSNPTKKKLIITQSNTPKCSISKMNLNLNINHNKQPQSFSQKHHHHQQIASQQQQQKDKLTERIQRSSGKKNADKCSTSQSKHNHQKRSFLGVVEGKLEEILVSSKKTLKSLSFGLKQTFDIILMNQQDLKLRKVFLMIKEVTDKICGIGEKYKQKCSRALQKIHSMEMIHQAYLVNEISHSKTRSKLESEAGIKISKKQSSIQAIILNENYDLRKKIHKLEKQLEYYTSQSASLNNVFGKFKNSQSQLKIANQLNHNYESSAQRQYEHNDGFSSSKNKLQKRRSSENLIYNTKQLGENHFSIHGLEQKRLSFDPALLQGSDYKKKILVSGYNNQKDLYASVGSSAYSQALYNQNEEYESKKAHRNNQVQELSEEEDSDNQQ